MVEYSWGRKSCPASKSFASTNRIRRNQCDKVSMNVTNDGRARIRKLGFGNSDSETWIRKLGFGNLDSETRIRKLGFGNTDSETKARKLKRTD